MKRTAAPARALGALVVSLVLAACDGGTDPGHTVPMADTPILAPPLTDDGPTTTARPSAGAGTAPEAGQALPDTWVVQVLRALGFEPGLLIAADARRRAEVDGPGAETEISARP